MKIKLLLLLTTTTLFLHGADDAGAVDKAKKERLVTSLIRLTNHNETAADILYSMVNEQDPPQFSPEETARGKDALKTYCFMNPDGTVQKSLIPAIKALLTHEMLPEIWETRVIVKGHGWMDTLFKE